MVRAARDIPVGFTPEENATYCATDSKNGHRNLSDVFLVPEIDRLEQVNVWNTVFDAGLLEPEKYKL